MSTRISCPGCGRSLALPADCTVKMLSCPRCLARIHNPQARHTSAAVQAAAPAASLPAAASSGVTERRSWTRTADMDVRRDSRGTSCGLIVLAVLGGIGISWPLVGGVIVAADDRDFTLLYFVLGFLLVLTVISATWVFVRHPGETPGTNIGRTMLGVLTISGVITAVYFLVGAAVVIYLFAVCLGSGGKFLR